MWRWVAKGEGGLHARCEEFCEIPVTKKSRYLRSIPRYWHEKPLPLYVTMLRHHT